MAKAGILERDGEVIEPTGGGKFKVKLKDTDMIITCYGSGKMRQAHISIIAGDWVKVEVNQYDMSQGRIVYRYNPANMRSAAVVEEKEKREAEKTE